VKGTAGAVLYTRRACPLCFTLQRLAERSSRRHGVSLVEADVDADPGLVERYGSRVPVLELPGGTSIAGRASAREVEDAFRRAAAFLRDLGTGGPGAGAMEPSPRSRMAWLRRVLGLGGVRAGGPTS
jgi:glutaredoxin